MDRVEHDLARTLRTADAFGRRFAGPPRVVWIVLLAVGSALLGVGGAIAAEESRSAREAALIIRRAEVRLASVARRASLSKERLARVERLFRAGVISAHDLTQARAAAEEGAFVRSRLVLELEEVRASKRPHQEDLSAPLVDGRDFVAERLDLDLAEAEKRLVRADESVRAVRRRYEVGATSQTEVAAAELRVGLTRVAVAAIKARIRLRQRFAARSESAERIDLLGMREDAEAARDLGELRLAAARTALTFVERAYAAGLIGPDEVERRKTQVEAAQQEIDLAHVDLKIIALALEKR